MRRVNAGLTSFGFGATNTGGGTGLSGNALATLNTQSITAGGNYTVVAAGSATTPTLFLLDNSVSGSLGTSQAAVRFVNLAPGAANPFTVFAGVLGAGAMIIATEIAGRLTNDIQHHGERLQCIHDPEWPRHCRFGYRSDARLAGGSVNTLAIVPTTSGGFQLTNLPRCS
jgi:hypothetical protein